jgi:hypothetical protein
VSYQHLSLKKLPASDQADKTEHRYKRKLFSKAIIVLESNFWLCIFMWRFEGVNGSLITAVNFGPYAPKWLQRVPEVSSIRIIYE